MTHMLDTIQIVNGLAWLTLMLSLTGSLVRLVLRKHRMPFDPIWSALWFLSLHQLGYILRWYFDLAHEPVGANDINTMLGLRVMSAMIAMALLQRRMAIEGWRW